jgi:hypothetical protein
MTNKLSGVVLLKLLFTSILIIERYWQYSEFIITKWNNDKIENINAFDSNINIKHHLQLIFPSTMINQMNLKQSENEIYFYLIYDSLIILCSTINIFLVNNYQLSFILFVDNILKLYGCYTFGLMQDDSKEGKAQSMNIFMHFFVPGLFTDRLYEVILVIVRALIIFKKLTINALNLILIFYAFIFTFISVFDEYELEGEKAIDNKEIKKHIKSE